MQSVKRNIRDPMSKFLFSRSNIFVVSAVFIFILVVVRTAWISDDAYITFRTIDNWVHGYGLTWNVYERVQVYTHPLWMLLISGFYFVTREMYYTTIFASIAISSSAVALFAFGIARTKTLACLGILLLLFSKAFIDYSTSGLENPLTHLILGVFFYVYLRSESGYKSLLLLSVIGGLGILNRLDTSLLFMPVILHSLFLMHSRLKAILLIALGLLPLLIWETFSLIYYGFLIPNTAYAKLDVGISRIDLMQQGSYYFWNSIKWDPLTLLTIFISLAIVFVTKDLRHRYVSLGVLFYLMYILAIGGDFMSGRFFSGLIFMAVIILSTSRINLTRNQTLVGAIGIVLIGSISLNPPILSGAGYGTEKIGDGKTVRHVVADNHGIADERSYYYNSSGLLNAKKGLKMPDSRMAEYGRLQQLKDRPAVAWSNIGFFGFFAGPQVYVVDRFAISNPMLARLPITTNSIDPITGTHWRIGHFPRELPEGYIESLESGENRINDQEISELYDRLQLITRGNLLDRNRLKAIWKMNTGR